jgi:hypothetical protein
MAELTNELTKAVTGLDIQGSKTLETKEISTMDSFLTNKPLAPVHQEAGTTYTAQNNLQLADISRVKEVDDLVEIDWNYKKTTSKPFFMDTALWTSALSAGTNLLTFQFPNDYFTGNHVLRTIGETFLSFRGDLHFVVSAQGTPVSSGAIIIHPQFMDLTTPYSIYDQYFRQHVILDISDNSSTADFVLPFRYYRNATDPFSTIANIYVDVLVPLAGIAQVNLTVTCFLENQEFKFLRPQEAVTARRTQGLLNFTTINQTLSNVQSATLPNNMTGDKLDTSVGLMDDVPINLNGPSMTVRYPSMNNSNNPHPLERASLIAGSQQISDKYIFNSSIDEMSFKHITQERDHFLQSISINTSVVTGQAVMAIPITPAPRIATSTTGDLTVSPIEYYSQFFKFWRGGFKIKLRFFMNRFQSMKFYVALFYKSISPAVFTDWSASHGVIIDIGGDTREVEIEVPYNSETPWLHCPTGPINFTGAYPNINSFSIFDFVLGQLSMYAMTPLITPEGSPTNITCHVTFSGSDDFEFANFTSSGAATQGSLLMSTRSGRTPNYITDNVVSVKQLVKKFANLSLLNSTFPLIKNIEAFIMNPLAAIGDTPDGLLPSGTLPGGTLYPLECENKIPGLLPYFAYRGSIVIRLEIKIYNNNAIPTAYTPFCFLCNPNMDTYSGTDAAIVAQNFIRDMRYYTLNGVEQALTPYELRPINSVGEIDSSIITYEVDIPYQRNLKYTNRVVPGFSDYGFLVFGATSEGASPGSIISIKAFAKIGDDGRFGILNYGSMQVHPSSTTNHNFFYYPTT